MKIELKITAARGCGKSTLADDIINAIASDFGDPEGLHVTRHTENNGTTESYTIRGRNHAERFLERYVIAEKTLSDEEFNNQWPKKETL